MSERVQSSGLKAYQHAFDAWQNKIKSEFVFSSNDYGKWAIATYNVKKRGLLKTVFFEDVRQAALTRARNYFQKAEALALEMQKSRSRVPAIPHGRGSPSTQFSNASAPLVRINQGALAGRWIVEVTAPDSGKHETFTLEIDARGQSGHVSSFGGASLIESITTDLGDPNLYVITTKPEKINKKQGQVVIRVRFMSENRLAGMLQLRRLSDGNLTPEAGLTAMRARD